MSAISADFAVPVAAPAVAPVLMRAVRATTDWVKRRYAIHTHRRILHSLPDHVLEDIGISRSQIDGIVPERLDHAGRPIGPYPF